MTCSLLETAPATLPSEPSTREAVNVYKDHGSRHVSTVVHRRAFGTDASGVDEVRVTSEAAHSMQASDIVEKQVAKLCVGRRVHDSARLAHCPAWRPRQNRVEYTYKVRVQQYISNRAAAGGICEFAVELTKSRLDSRGWHLLWTVMTCPVSCMQRVKARTSWKAHLMI